MGISFIEGLVTPMRCLVTGGAGFIGSHLSERLLNDGHVVSIIDNCSTGRWENIEHIAEHSNLNIFEGDINNQKILANASEGAEWVFHLAALADIVPSIENPINYMEANVKGTLSVLEASRKQGVKRFIYAASSSCYGLPDIFPTPETSPARPQYPYALSKYLGEQCVMHWSQLYSLPAISFRLFNIFGPRSRTSGTYGAVFGVFLAQKLAGMPFTVVGDGEQTRDFTYVTDAVDAFIEGAKSEINGEIMNIGSNGTYSVNQLVELLGGTVKYIPKRPGEPECTFADTAKIETFLSWHPKISFATGVQQMLFHIDYWRETPVWTEKSIAKATETWFKYLKK